MSNVFVQVNRPLEVEINSQGRVFKISIDQINAEKWLLKKGLDASTESYNERVEFKLIFGNSYLSGSGHFDGQTITALSKQEKDLFLDFLHRVRKEQHIDLCSTQDVESAYKKNGFEDFELPVVSLPELAWDEIDTSQMFMGKKFGLPLLITGMTGGVERASEINERLAKAAVAFNIPMGVGSQRLALENSEHAKIFQLKHKFPDLFLIGNIGIGQIRGSNYLDLCKKAVDMIEADALAIHINVLQELIQVEGDRDFRGLKDRIAMISSKLSVPVIVKEVGAGLDARTANDLHKSGLKYFDVGGSGGTSWAHIEGLRSSDSHVNRMGLSFRNWGIPTAKALQNITELKLKNIELVATGGIRDGVTVLKAIKYGATMTGIGLPLFKAALLDEGGPIREIEVIARELKVAMICGGMKNL